MDRFRKIKPIGASESSQIIPFDVEKKLTSHVPDLVVFDKNPAKIPHILKFDGVLLFADVSGFTALTEKYTVSSEKGTDALTVTLNNYIGKIVQKILQAGGDILKFAGDAILAVWKVKERSFLKHAISQASKCSLEIQDKCDNQETDVGVKLRVKIAISAGKIFATFVGNEQSRHFVMAGRPVREVNAAEKYCEAGLVVLSPNAMELSDRTNVLTQALAERFGLVKYLRHEPRLQWQEYVDIPKHMKFTTNAETSIRLALGIRGDISRETVIRKYVSPVVQRKLDDDQQLRYLSEMRQCSIAFINLSFDLNERDRLFHEKQCENMQTSFSIVYANITARQGSLNKIFMFDKGCTFLVIFGLPGDKHEQEPAHALQAAWKIKKELEFSTLDSLTLCSIGVTTGPVFCGVIGHEERHEYTVIGQKVNLAARLMMHYPNVVSCDCETFKCSKLSKEAFTRLPHKAMKGVGDVVVYDYTEGERKPVATTIITEPEYPIIGRREEVGMFMDELLKTMNTPSLGKERRVIVFEGEAGYGKTRVMKEIQWQAACTEGIRVISFTLSINDINEPFFAVKTLLELLLEIESCKDDAVKEKSLKAAMHSEDSEYLCLFNDLITWFNFPVSKKVEKMEPEERTKMLHGLMVKLVKKTTADQFVLFALDDAQNVDPESWNFITTLSKDAKALCVVALRPFSPDKPPCQPAKQVLFHPKTVYFKLHGLDNDQLTPLACQMLQVERIPIELESFLIQRCHNVPLWCEQLLIEMLNAGVLLIVPLSSKTAQGGKQKGEFHGQSHFKPSVGIGDVGLIKKRLNSIAPETTNTEKPPVEIVVEETKNENDEENPTDDRNISCDQQRIESKQGRKRSSLTSWSNRVRYLQNTSPDMDEFLKHGPETHTTMSDHSKDMYHPMRCVIKPGFILSKFPMPASIRGMALTRLDRMMPFEQLVVKCAAVIGENVSRKMLKAVVPGCNDEKFRRAIYQLMKTRVFECASEILVAEKPIVKEKQKVQLDRMSHCITCACHIGSESLDDRTITERCEQLKFQKTLVQETAYNLWLADQRRSLHEACANFLEAKIDQILITGSTDEEIRMQFHLSRIFNKINETNSKRALVIKSSRSLQDSASNNRDLNVLTSAPNIAVQLSSEDFKSSSKAVVVESNFLGTPDFNQRRISHGSVIGRMTASGMGARKSVCVPLVIEEEILADDYIECNHSIDIANSQNNGNNTSAKVETEQDYIKSIVVKVDKRKSLGENKIPESEYRRLSFAPLWSQSIGVTSSFDRIINNTEEQAKQLAHLKLNSILRTPFEIHETCALLYNQLVWHWRRALNTEKTITFLLKASESSIAINGYNAALSYLKEAFKIVSHLDKGLDIVCNFTEDDDLNLDDIKVLSVSKETKAKIQSLLGQVLFKQGSLEESLQHFYKALKILGSKIQTNSLCISFRTWYESKVQAYHVSNPTKYIGRASSKVANKYVEQVRCLSYVWQILLNVKNIPNRMKMSKLVALMQVNRAESADDDLQELITSYTYMMQMYQLAGLIDQSIYYEGRATARCLELPSKLTVPDLFITGHLHLVSCSVRLCQGKLAYAMTSGYRAYNVADTLGDVDIKLLVLPIIFQIHLLTEKGKACTAILKLLLEVAKENNDEIGKSSYYTSCFDLILDASYSLESANTCVSHIQNMESTIDIGDVPRFYFRTSMAVWCYRRNMISEGKAWLKLSTEIKPECLDGYLSARGFTRLVEAHLLKFRTMLMQNGSKDKDTKKEEDFCRSLINKFQLLCKSFPVFSPKLHHFNAFFHLEIGNKTKAKDLITKAINSARFCGNTIDNVWATHSQNIWFTPNNYTPKQLNKWVDNCQESISWETANQRADTDWCFSFLPISNF